jgi:alkanesulfonate monooxygenase SsuD/methylene tetrahydromethanopterin reductase-like flavin-dependent oxidoreductase (luciferase family)
MMRFGVVLRGQFDPGEDPRTSLEELYEQARLAESLGYESITKTSHYSTHPLQMLQQIPLLARLSAEAPKLRLNAGVVLVALHKPLDLAEQLASLDVISGGKLIFGAALGYREVEYKAFGADRSRRGALLEENLEAILRLWTEETVDMVGSHFELDGASCSIKPLQKPYPPLWIGANADVAIERAARLGDCWYVNPHNSIAVTERQLEVYKKALDDNGKPFPEEFPMRREVFVARTREEALRQCGPYLAGKYKSYRDWGQQHEMPDDDDLAESFDELAGDRFLLGSPDEVAEQMVGLAKRLGINHLIMSVQWPGMPHPMVLDTMRMLAEEVFPKVNAALGSP